MRPLRTAHLLFSLAPYRCTNSRSSKTHKLLHMEHSECNNSNYKISRRGISFNIRAAEAAVPSAASTINKAVNKNSNLINDDDDDDELWQLYGHPAGDVNNVESNSNKINENESSIDINTKEDKLPIFTSTENKAELNKEANMRWIDAIKAYEAECYAHPLEPSQHIRLNLLHSIEGALQLPCTRREREVCKLWKYALEVHNKAISHSSITPHTQNDLHETCNEIKMLCNIFYYSREYVECVALVHAHLATLEKYMEMYHDKNKITISSKAMLRSSSHNDESSGYKELEEGRKKSEEQQQPEDSENRHNVKTLLSLMWIVSVYFMSLSQHKSWVWEVRSEEKEEEYHVNDINDQEHVYMKTMEHSKPESVMTSSQQNSSKIQRVCQFATLLLEQSNKLLHNNIASIGENSNIAKNNKEDEKQVTQYVIILISAMEWLLFHSKNIANHNEMVSGAVVSLQGVVSHKVIQEWRNVVHEFPFAPTCLLHENTVHQRCISDYIKTNKWINKTPLGIMQYVHQLSLTTWHDWTSLVRVFHYVLEQESTWPLYRIFALSITIGNQLISCNTSWINNLYKQQSVQKTREFILSTLGTSIDVKALVHYGTLPNNKKKSKYGATGDDNDAGDDRSKKCNTHIEECKNANHNMNNMNANIIHHNNNSLTPYNNTCLSIVCSMSGLEAYKGVQELLRHTASNEEEAFIQETYGDILTGQKDHNWRSSLTRLQTQLAEGKSREWRSELAHTLRLLSDANKFKKFLLLIHEYNMMESSNYMDIENCSNTIKNHNLCVASSLAHVIERSGKWWYVHEVVSLIAHASLPQDEEEEYYLHNACIRSLQALAHAKKWKEAVQLHSSLREIMPSEALEVLCSMLVAMPAFSSWRSVVRYITSLQHLQEPTCEIMADKVISNENKSNNNLNHYMLPPLSSSNIQVYHNESKTLETTDTNNTINDDVEEEEVKDDEVFIRKSKLPEPYLTQLLAARGKVCVKEINNVEVRRRSLRLLSENGHWKCIYDYISTLTHKNTINIHHRSSKSVATDVIDDDNNNDNKLITPNRFILSLWSLLLFAFMHCDLIKESEAINVFSKAPLYDLAMNNVTWLQTVYVVALDHGWLPKLLDMLTNITDNNHINKVTSVNGKNSKRSKPLHEKVMHSIQEYVVLLHYVLHGVLPEKTFVFTNTFVIHMLYSLNGVCNFVVRVSLPYNLRKEIVEQRSALTKQTVAQALHVSALSVGALPTEDAITQSVIHSHNNVDDAKRCSVSIFVLSESSEHIDARALIHITELKTESEPESQHENVEQIYCKEEDYYDSTMQINKINKRNEVTQNDAMTKGTVNSANTSTNTKQVIIIGYKPPAAEISNVAHGLLHHVHHTKHFEFSSSTRIHKCLFYTLYYLSPASHGLFVLCSSTVSRLRFEVTLTVRMSLAPITNAHVALLSASFYNKYRMNLTCSKASDLLMNTHAKEETWMEIDELKEVPHALCTDTNNNDSEKMGNISSSSIVTVEATCTTNEVKSMNNVLHNLITDMNSEGWGLVEPDCGVGESLCITHIMLRDRLDASNVIVTNLHPFTSTSNYKEQRTRSSSEEQNV